MNKDDKEFAKRIAKLQNYHTGMVAFGTLMIAIGLVNIQLNADLENYSLPTIDAIYSILLCILGGGVILGSVQVIDKRIDSL